MPLKLQWGAQEGGQPGGVDGCHLGKKGENFDFLLYHILTTPE
ncbi:hypothetical protein [Dictyobacter halimunensis]